MRDDVAPRGRPVPLEAISAPTPSGSSSAVAQHELRCGRRMRDLGGGEDEHADHADHAHEGVFERAAAGVQAVEREAVGRPPSRSRRAEVGLELAGLRARCSPMRLSTRSAASSRRERDGAARGTRSAPGVRRRPRRACLRRRSRRRA